MSLVSLPGPTCRSHFWSRVTAARALSAPAEVSRKRMSGRSLLDLLFVPKPPLPGR